MARGHPTLLDQENSENQCPNKHAISADHQYDDETQQTQAIKTLSTLMSESSTVVEQKPSKTVQCYEQADFWYQKGVVLN